MMLIRTFVGPSNIHGLGCFANEPIRAGQRAWSLCDLTFDRVWNAHDYSSLPPIAREQIARFVYVCKHTSRIIYCVDDARYLNHSADPNLMDSGRGINDYALRDIDVGEELTVDYRTFAMGNAP